MARPHIDPVNVARAAYALAKLGANGVTSSELGGIELQFGPDAARIAWRVMSAQAEADALADELFGAICRMPEDAPTSPPEDAPWAGEQASAHENELEMQGFERHMQRQRNRADLADALRRATEALRDAAGAIEGGAAQ